MKHRDFKSFLSAKRRERGLTSVALAEKVEISPSYYSELENGRKSKPDCDILDKIVAELNLSDEDKVMFYDLAGKARSDIAPDLPEYIMANEHVRVALRVARDKASADDWKQFIDKLANK